MSEKVLRNWLMSHFFLMCFSLISQAVQCQKIGQQNEIQNYISNYIPVVNQNWEVFQDPVSRFIYFANSAGLIEYNGISTKTFTMPLGQGVRSVYVNTDGLIFTGSFEDFGYWKKDPSGELIYSSLANGISVKENDEIWDIYESGGVIYFLSFTTAYTYDYKSVKAINCPSNMLFFFKAGDRFIAQSLERGLFWFDGKEFTFIDGSETFGSLKVHAVIDFMNDVYWICTANNGIYFFDGHNFTPQTSEISEYLKVETCNAGLAINDSLIVFGTILKGVVFCNKSGKILESYDYSNGLNNNTVLSLFKDYNNGLWIGLDEGANYIDLLSPVTLYTNSNGILGTIYSILFDNNKLFLGTNHGLFEADISKKKERYTFSNLKIVPHTQGQVWTIEKFDNQILCGHNDGTYLLDNNTFRQISDVTGGWSIKEYNNLLIEGTYTGIIFFSKDLNGRWMFRNRIKGYSEPTRHIEVDYLGYIWASHPQKGIYKLELNEALDSVVNKQYFDLIDGKLMSFDIFKINNQVVFTNSESCYKFDYDKKEIIPFSELNNTLGQYQSASLIIPYTRNNYWFIMGKRIALFEISKAFIGEKKLELMQKYSDLPERELQIIRLSEKTVLIPTRQAFITYNLSLIRNIQETSNLHIRKLLFQGKKGDYLVTTDTAEIRIPFYLNNLKAYFSDPSGFDKEDKEYQYRMSEIDSSWYSTQSDNLSYLNLPYGNYKLEIKSDLSNSYSQIFFSIDRPWYLSTFALIIYLLIITLIIIFSIRIFRIELKKQKQLVAFEINNIKLVNELDSRSYELMLTMRYLIQKNEILTELHMQINSLKEQSSKFPVKFIREMERIIKGGLETQTEEWKNAVNSLKLSQQGFFKRLIEKHSNLTPNDLRLCSYLRMNFTTKEIAKLLNISARAVEISRYRLRRKMNLEHDINLIEYLIRVCD